MEARTELLIMKSFVITIENIPESVKSADRCIASAARCGVKVNRVVAITPENDPVDMFRRLNLSTKNFESNKYSRYERCLSAFLSHRLLWTMCAEQKDNILILEHDAVFTNTLPTSVMYDKNIEIVSFGAPSYGKYNTPSRIGVNPLTSKAYFPGAHAYMMTPSGAKKALEESFKTAQPTDIFFNVNSFPDLKEFYPWPISVEENFSTIQRQEGCLAKHDYKEGLGYTLL